MPLSSGSVNTLFWGLFAAEMVAAVGAVAVVAGNLFGVGRRSGPDGAVGAWIVLLPPIFLLGVLAVFLNARSEGLRLTLVMILAGPLLMAALGPVRTAVLNWQVGRMERGDDSFSSSAHRALAHAIHEANIGEVKRLILKDRAELSRPHGGETFLRFALVNLRPQADPVATRAMEVLRLVLEAGADPNVPAFETNWPLTLAIMHGADATEALLKHGADPNRLDGAGRPLWWDSLSSTNYGGAFEAIQRLGKIDPAARDSESGAAAYAAYFKNWDAAWGLVQAGAPWSGERRYGDTVEAMLSRDIESRNADRTPVTAAMRELERLSNRND